MAVERLSNNAQTTLSAAITTGTATTLTVASATGFPGIVGPPVGQFRILIDSEIMLVTGVSGTTWTVTRAVEPVAGVTAAATHANGATVTHILTNGALANASISGTFPGDLNMFAIGGAPGVSAGTMPAIGTGRFLIQSGSNVVTTNASGVVAINYPTAFPTAVSTVIACMGDNGYSAIVLPITSTILPASFQASVFYSNTAAALVSLTVRINWLALGA